MSCGLYLFWLLHVFDCIVHLFLMLVFNLLQKHVINKLLQLNNATDISFLG